jgi:hypothetical protein
VRTPELSGADEDVDEDVDEVTTSTRDEVLI